MPFAASPRRLFATAVIGLFAAAALPGAALAAKPDPAKIRAAADKAVADAGLACQVSEATNPGKAGKEQVYEVSCADGPGWIIVATNPPQVFNCLAIAASVAAGGTASSQCALPANLDAAAAVRAPAAALGITCTIDQAAWVGRVPDQADRYEVGCAGTDGYWIEIDLKGKPKSRIECLEIVTANRACNFSTEAERLGGFKARLAGTTAAACDVGKIRIAGDTATDRYYEVACNGSTGMMVAFSLQSGAFSKSYDCAVAQRVAGGCQLPGRPPVAVGGME